MAVAPRYRKAISRAEMNILRSLPKEHVLSFLEDHYMVKKRGPKRYQCSQVSYLTPEHLRSA